jgi:tetratricopeptide (TPR) repeat protein
MTRGVARAGRMRQAFVFGLLVLCPAVAGAGQTDDLIRFHQGRVAADPDDALGYNRLASAYIQEARETGDVAYYGLAEKAVVRSLELVPRGAPAASATTTLAAIHLARHEFKSALQLAQRAIDLGAADPAPHAIAGDAYIELGDYAEARRAYARLESATGARASHTRLAYLRFLNGDGDGAIADMRRALAATRGATGEPRAWTEAQLGELLFHRGRLGESEAAYEAALAAYPGYHRALAGLGRVRAAQGRETEAVEHYRRALAVIPLPEYAAALGDVYTRLGRADAATKQYALVEYIGRLNALNRAIHNRELALFYADRGTNAAAAVDLARRELDARRDVYTYDVLAWTLFKSGRPTEARDAVREAVRLGTPDARLLFHAGMIHQALGDTAQARRYLEQALALNPQFHPLQADVAARALRQLRAATP